MPTLQPIARLQILAMNRSRTTTACSALPRRRPAKARGPHRENTATEPAEPAASGNLPSASPAPGSASDGHLVSFRSGPVRWRVAAEWQEVLLDKEGLVDAEGLRLPALLTAGLAQMIKRGPHRIVYRVRLRDRILYVKHYRQGQLGRALSHLVRPCAAWREWNKIRQVAARGIPTVRPVAWGREVRGGLTRDSYLVTESLEAAHSVEHWASEILPKLPAPMRLRFRRRLIEAIGRLTAAVHAAGIWHDDYHAGNILVRVGDGLPGAKPLPAEPELFLIDLPGVRAGKPLGRRESIASLAMLLSGWWDQLDRFERYRFWRSYRTTRSGEPIFTPQRDTAAIERSAQRRARRVQRGRDRRPMRSNRSFAATRDRRGWLHRIDALPSSSAEAVLADPERLLWQYVHAPVKLSHTSVMVRAMLPGSSPQTSGREDRVAVAYKRFRPRTPFKAIAAALRPHAALRNWKLGHALLARGIATARPLLVCLPRRPWWRRPGYLASQWIDGAENLHLWGWQIAHDRPSLRLRRAAKCAESLGNLIGRLHAWQLSHRDLKAANLLVRERNAEPETWLIDLEGLCIRRHLTYRRRVADLGRLAASIEAHPWLTPPVMLRFIRSYLRNVGLAANQLKWKRLWRDVQCAAEKRNRHKRRKRKAIL